MRLVIGLGVLTASMTLVGCAKSPKQVAEAACPIITHSAAADQVGRIKALTDQGMTAGSAATAVDRYDSLAFDMDDFPAGKDNVCSSVITNDQKQLALWQQTVDQKRRSDQETAARRASLRRTVSEINTVNAESNAALCRMNALLCR